jgi:hypothetical protein
MSAANFCGIVKTTRRARRVVRSSSLLVKVLLATITMRWAVCRSGGSYTAASRHHLRRKCSKLQGRAQLTQNDVCNLILSLLLLPAFVESIFQVQLGVSNTDKRIGNGDLQDNATRNGKVRVRANSRPGRCVGVGWGRGGGRARAPPIRHSQVSSCMKKATRGTIPVNAAHVLP